MAVTPVGNPYVESSDLVANYPGVSEALAERIDIVGVNPFADSAARATAIPSPTEGMMSSLNDTDAVERYDGATWKPVGGKVLQVVNVQTSALATGTTQIPHDATIPQITEGDQYMSLAITPTNVSNVLVIQVITYTSFSVALHQLTQALFKNTDTNALAISSRRGTTQTDEAATLGFVYSMVAGTTSPITYKVRCGAGGVGTTAFNGRPGVQEFGACPKSSITITEYTP